MESVILRRARDSVAASKGLSRRQALMALGGIGLTPAVVNLKRSQMQSGVNLADFVAENESDHTLALQRAIQAGGGAVYVPDGVFEIDTVQGDSVHFYGRGSLRKKPGTKGVMLHLSGNNRIDGLTIDYSWQNCEMSRPYVNNIAVYQQQGMLILSNVTFRRSFYAAVYIEGGSLRTDKDCAFLEAIPHNDMRGPAARLSHYILCVSDARTSNQTITIEGGIFVGASLDRERLHLNPTAIFITPEVLDGAKFSKVSIVGSSFIGCSTNCGEGNITGAIDIYNGANNISIIGVTVRLFTYAAIKVQNSSNFRISGNTISEGVVPLGAYVPHSNGCITTQRVRGSKIVQSIGIVSDNKFSDMQYIGINNGCDEVIIQNNIIDGVSLSKLGDGIHNTGERVQILGNVGRNICGTQIYSSGNRCKIISNRMDNGFLPSQVAIFFSGSGAVIEHNILRTAAGSGGSGIRTDGPASGFYITDNTVDGFPYGVDIRATAGSVREGHIEGNTYIGNGSALNISDDVVAVRVI